VKKLLLLLVVLAVVTSMLVLPIATYAYGHDQHDQAWKQHHDQTWKAHEKQWGDYDRQWRAHRGDRHWREEHIKMWHDWYQWHRDNESVLKIKVGPDSHGGPTLDIDFRS